LSSRWEGLLSKGRGYWRGRGHGERGGLVIDRRRSEGRPGQIAGSRSLKTETCIPPSRDPGHQTERTHMSDTAHGTQKRDPKGRKSQPKRKLKLGKQLFKKGFTKYRAAKGWKTFFRHRCRILPDQPLTPWTFPLLPFWALGYYLSYLVLRIREMNLNLNLNAFRIVVNFYLPFSFWDMWRLPVFLAGCILLGIWGLLRGLWLAIKTFCLFICFVIVGCPGFLRDCQYFVGKCTYPSWQGMNIHTRLNLM
jgi:hypothetical protein